MRWQAGVLATGMVLGLSVAALGQEEERAPDGYFDCPYVNYFDPDCPQLRKPPTQPERRRPDGREAPAAAPETQEPGAAAEADDGRPRDLDADDVYPLFPRESLAPDAPPLLRLLLANPTLDNARRYVRWYARRSERLRAVQALIELAGREER